MSIPMNRRALLQSLAGTSLVGLRAMATGLPAAFLLNPKQAVAETADPNAARAQYLVLSTSTLGDALNCNVPGTYDLPSTFATGSVNHPAQVEMAPTTLTLGGIAYTAAKPWASLPADVLARTTFFHHATGTANHGELGRVFQLFGALRRDQWLPSYFAKVLAPTFKTIQTKPITLGGEQLSFDGQYLPRLTPLGLKNVLGGPQGLAATLQGLRDATLNDINAVLKANRAKTQSERAFLDNAANSQTDLRRMIEQASGDLAKIVDDSPKSQLLAAALLIKMNVTPVVTVHLPFSGDNHVDVNFANETAQTTASIANIRDFQQTLKTYGIADKVTFATLNVFGRTYNETTGRTHHPAHAVSVMIGRGIRPGVIGGLIPPGKAANIDSATGLASASGDIAFNELLPSVAKTMGMALGLTRAQVDDQITSGKVVGSALA
jgi:hypothetical protein